MEKVLYKNFESFSLAKIKDLHVADKPKSVRFQGVKYTYLGYTTSRASSKDCACLFFKALFLLIGTLFLALIIPKLRAEILANLKGKKVKAIYFADTPIQQKIERVTQNPELPLANVVKTLEAIPNESEPSHAEKQNSEKPEENIPPPKDLVLPNVLHEEIADYLEIDDLGEVVKYDKVMAQDIFPKMKTEAGEMYKRYINTLIDCLKDLKKDDESIHYVKETIASLPFKAENIQDLLIQSRLLRHLIIQCLTLFAVVAQRSIFEKIKDKIQTKDLDPFLKSSLIFLVDVTNAVFELSKDISKFKNLSEELKNDRDVVLALIEKDYSELQNAGETIRNNNEFLLNLIADYGEDIFKYAGPVPRNDPEVVLAALDQAIKEDPAGARNYYKAKENPASKRNRIGDNEKDQSTFSKKVRRVNRLEKVFQNLGDRLQNDKAFFISLLNKYGYSFYKYANEALRNDRDVFLTALDLADKDPTEDYKPVRITHFMCMHDGNKAQALLNNKEFFLSLPKEFIQIVHYASDSLKNDPNFFLAIIDKDINVLRDASDTLKKDEVFFRTLIEKTGKVKVLDHADEGIKNNKAFFLSLQNQLIVMALEFASWDLKGDTQFFLELMDKGVNYRVLEHADRTLKNDEVFFITLLEKTKDDNVLVYASNALKNNKSFFLEALKKTNNSKILHSAGKNLRNDKEFALAVMEFDRMSYFLFTKEIQEDNDVKSKYNKTVDING